MSPPLASAASRRRQHVVGGVTMLVCLGVGGSALAEDTSAGEEAPTVVSDEAWSTDPIPSADGQPEVEPSTDGPAVTSDDERTDDEWTDDEWTDDEWTDDEWTDDEWTDDEWTDDEWTDDEWTDDEWTDDEWTDDAADSGPVWSEGSSETVHHIQDGAISDDPSRVDVLHQEHIEDAANLAEVMEWLPGGTLYEAGSTNAAIVIDGLPSAHISVFIDGVPHSRLINNREGPSVDLRSVGLDPSEIRRVEVHRGVGPPGSGSTGGVAINLVTADAPERLAAYGRITAGTEFESLYRWNGAGMLVAPLSDTLSTSVSGSFSTAEPLDINDDDRIDTTGTTLQHGRWTTRWAPSRNEGLQLTGLYDGVVTEHFNLVGGDSHDRVETTNASGVVAGRWWLVDRDLRLEHNHAYNRFGHRFDNVVDTGARALVADTRQERLRNVVLVSGWPGTHDLSGELTLDAIRVRRYAAQSDEEPEDPLLNGEPIDQTIVGAGSNHRWTPLEDVEHRSRVYVEYDNLYDVGWIGQTALAWQLSDELTLRTGFSRTRRTPLVEERYYTFSHRSVGYEIRGNESLIPEVLWTGRLGASWSNEEDTLGFEAEGFYHHISDHISFANVCARDDDGDCIDGEIQPGVITYANTSAVRLAGANASFAWSDLPGGLEARASYAWLPIAEKLIDDGFPLVYRAEHSVRGELLGRWFNNRFEAGIDISGRSAVDVITAAGTVEEGAAPEYLIAGAMLSFDITRDLELRLRFDNLGNQVEPTWGPKPGRRAMLTLEFEGGDGEE